VDFCFSLLYHRASLDNTYRAYASPRKIDRAEPNLRNAQEPLISTRRPRAQVEMQEYLDQGPHMHTRLQCRCRDRAADLRCGDLAYNARGREGRAGQGPPHTGRRDNDIGGERPGQKLLRGHPNAPAHNLCDGFAGCGKAGHTLGHSEFTASRELIITIMPMMHNLQTLLPIDKM
jgi:hypothetical protein